MTYILIFYQHFEEKPHFSCEVKYMRLNDKKSLKIPKGVIGSRKWKDRRHIGQLKKDKRINNNLLNYTYKTKD